MFVILYTLALVVGYIVVLTFSPRWRAPSLKVVLLISLLAALPYFLHAPGTSTDVYANGYYGQLINQYGENPYTIAPTAHVSSPYLDLLLAPHPFRTTYGPLWTSLDALVLRYTGDTISSTVTVFRTFLLLSFLGSLLLLWLLMGRHPHWGLALVAWNPSLLFEFIQNAHNDAAVLPLVLAAFLAYRLRRDLFVLPLLVVAGMLKFSALFLLPLATILLLRRHLPRRQRLTTLALGVLTSAIVLVATWFPYWEPGITLQQFQKLSQSVGVPFFHPLSLLISLLRLVGVDQYAAEWAAYGLGIATTLVGLLLIAWAAWRRTVRPEHGAFLSLTLPPLFSTYFQPWYLSWAMPFGAFLPTGVLRPYFALATTLAFIAALWY